MQRSEMKRSGFTVESACWQAAVTDTAVSVCSNVTVSSDSELLTALIPFEEYAPTLSYYDTCVRTIFFVGAQTQYHLSHTITLDAGDAVVGLVLNATGLSETVTIFANDGRHFHLSKVKLTAENVRFSGGAAGDGGGSIYATLDSLLTFSKVAFANNTANGYGGTSTMKVSQYLRGR